MSKDKKRGRPSSALKRDRKIQVRLREDEMALLAEVASYHDMTIADVVRLGIEDAFAMYRQGINIREKW